MSTSGPTQVVEVTEDRLDRYVVSAEDVGLSAGEPGAVEGGTPERNAATTRAILSGEAGAPRDLAALNAGAAIYVSGRVDTLGEGVRAAEAAIDDGAAAQALERFVARTRELAPA
jgi:anthranilate phosphoribosyltransferase